MARSYPSDFITFNPDPKLMYTRLRLRSTHTVLDPLPYAAAFGGTGRRIDDRTIEFTAQPPVSPPAVAGMAHIDFDSASGPPDWEQPPQWIASVTNPGEKIIESIVIQSRDIEADALELILKAKLPDLDDTCK